LLRDEKVRRGGEIVGLGLATTWGYEMMWWWLAAMKEVRRERVVKDEAIS